MWSTLIRFKALSLFPNVATMLNPHSLCRYRKDVKMKRGNAFASQSCQLLGRVDYLPSCLSHGPWHWWGRGNVSGYVLKWLFKWVLLDLMCCSSLRLQVLTAALKIFQHSLIWLRRSGVSWSSAWRISPLGGQRGCSFRSSGCVTHSVGFDANKLVVFQADACADSIPQPPGSLLPASWQRLPPSKYEFWVWSVGQSNCRSISAETGSWLQPSSCATSWPSPAICGVE